MDINVLLKQAADAVWYCSIEGMVFLLQHFGIPERTASPLG